MAVVRRIQVLNQHECHAGIGRQMVEQLRECLQPAGGGSDANNGGDAAFGVLFRVRPLRPPQARTSGLRWTLFRVRAARRFGGASGLRAECATPPGGRLSIFFATRHHYLSLPTNGHACTE